MISSCWKHILFWKHHVWAWAGTECVSITVTLCSCIDIITLNLLSKPTESIMGNAAFNTWHRHGRSWLLGNGDESELERRKMKLSLMNAQGKNCLSNQDGCRQFLLAACRELRRRNWSFPVSFLVVVGLKDDHGEKGVKSFQFNENLNVPAETCCRAALQDW